MPTIAAHIAAWPRRPLISVVVPVCDPEERWLVACIESVRAQLYEEWEPCIADHASRAPWLPAFLADHARRDPRIRITERRTHVVPAQDLADLGEVRVEEILLVMCEAPTSP